MKLKFFDVLVIVGALLLVVLSSIYAYSGKNGPLYVHVESARDEWYLPLSKDTSLDVKGPIGITKVEVVNGKAHVVSSPCREKICIRAGFISRPGQWVACLPNRVFLSIEGRGDSGSEVDAVNF